MSNPLIVVIGDVHHHIGLAAQGLERIEMETGRRIGQVFSVGDFGLFLDESDWDFLTGPKKYRDHGASPKIRAAWKAWRWPLSMIAGNHEPFHLLRDWNPASFSYKLEYTNAGELKHSIPGLRVAGLSGIYHPEDMEFTSALERKHRKLPHDTSWPDMVRIARERIVSLSLLSYYKQHEVEHLCSLDVSPHLLLLHDWPTPPAHINQIHSRRPEGEILHALNPPFLCCGHHHTPAEWTIDHTRVLALNIISTPERIHHHGILPGWAALFEWDQTTLKFLHTWPRAVD